MEMVLSNGFCEMTQDEVLLIDAGTSTAGRMVMMIGGAIVAGVVAPVTCGGSLAAYAAIATTGYGMMVVGAFDW